MLSYAGRINYDYKKKYMLTATFRATDRRFLKGTSGVTSRHVRRLDDLGGELLRAHRWVVDDLKLRVSYGQTGNNHLGQ